MKKTSNIFYGPEGASPNYDEEKVSPYELPDLFLTVAGEQVSSFDEWFSVRRPEILSVYEKSIFGTSPLQARVSFRKSGPERVDATKGIRAQLYDLYLDDKNALLAQFIVFTPLNAKEAVPAFLGPNVLGNQSLTDLFSLPLSISWVYPRPALGIDATGYATVESVGVHSSRWPLDMIIKRGFAVVSFHYSDLFPDKPGGRPESIQPLFDVSSNRAYSWGAVATWAWGMIKVMDCLKDIDAIDEQKVIATGHSRLGKACLWAGAQDKRFAGVIANESGEGGSAISRRKFGERVSDIVRHFPHWFNDEYRSFVDNEENMPVDSHFLISLLAPRAVYVASAEDDLWSDPKGEFAGLVGASKIWKLYGNIADLSPYNEMPLTGKPLSEILSYHVRSGGHDITAYDWKQFLNFADKFIK